MIIIFFNTLYQVQVAGGQGFSSLFNPSLPCVCSSFLPLSLLPWSTHKHRTYATTERGDKGNFWKGASASQWLGLCCRFLLYSTKYSSSGTFWEMFYII